MMLRPSLKKLATKRTLIGASLLTLIAASVYKINAMVAEPTTDKGCPELLTATSTETEAMWSTIASVLWKQVGGAINDASCVGETPVHGIISVRTPEEVRTALTYAKNNDLTVSIAGVRHSMGGQTVAPGNLVIDMLSMNAVTINEETMTMTVEAGATWHDIQNILHPRFAVSAMQSTDIFSVGGSISVNAHGMDHRIGGIENSIRNITVMLPDGTIKRASRTENTDLYDAVVGGYGLVAIILSTELEIVSNEIYTSKRIVMPFSAFPDYFKNEIEGNDAIGLMYTHLSTAPTSLLDEAIVYVYEKTAEEIPVEAIPPLSEITGVKLRRFFMSFSKEGAVAQQIRWWAEKYLEPRFESCSISRTEAMRSGEACFVARNEPMHDSVPYLYNNLKKETDILHEYFIPRDRITDFIDGMRVLVTERDINLLNTSVRVVQKERGLLSYAPEEAFSVVLFINQPLTESGHEKMRADTMALIDLAHVHGGRFFLPYQLYYTSEQLRTSYPTVDEFIARKRAFDPEERLQTTFWHHLTAGQKS